MLAWDHNASYHRVLLRQLPARADRVLDVGCGTGELAVRLAARAGRVDALDRDPAVLGAARAVVPANVTTVLADVMGHPLAPSSYDAIVSLSALHHLDLQPALERLSGALRPGGVLAVVAVARVDLPRELPVEAAAVVWHHLVGAVLAARHPRCPAAARPVPVPTRQPTLTTREVRRLAPAVLPGVRVRRLLLWRYLLTWSKPAARE